LPVTGGFTLPGISMRCTDLSGGRERQHPKDRRDRPKAHRLCRPAHRNFTFGTPMRLASQLRTLESDALNVEFEASKCRPRSAAGVARR
jgi:hypothetical protein